MEEVHKMEEAHKLDKKMVQKKWNGCVMDKKIETQKVKYKEI